MINIQFVFGFIGAAVGIVIGILVFGQIVVAVSCPGEAGYTNDRGVLLSNDNIGKYQVTEAATKSGGVTGQAIGDLVGASRTSATAELGATTPYNMGSDHYNPGKSECNGAKTTAWTVLGILPITLFFVLFSIFGAFGRQE